MTKFAYDLGELNLDAMTEADLADLLLHLTILSLYAAKKMNAMQFRRTGRITSALKIEAEMQKLYDELPDNWRW